jgi:putative hemolysin
MSLFKKEEISKVTKLDKIKLDALTTPLMKILKLDKLNQLYEIYEGLKDREFINAVLDEFEIKFTIDEKEINHIPKEGSFIVIANHPYGGIDGLILMKVMCDVRPDFKIMGNFLLQKLKPIEHLIIPVNPFDNVQVNKSSLVGIKKTIEYLQNGTPIGIFPAGEVSSFQSDSKKVIDREWKPAVARIIQKAQVPVIPVYFSGGNSKLFNILGMIHPVFRTIKIPSELLNKKGQEIKIRIGKPILPKTYNEFEEPTQMLRFLRAKTYALGSPLEKEVKNFFRVPFLPQKEAEEIIPPVPIELLEKDIEKLVNTNYHLVTQDDCDVFVAPINMIPNVITEIGRLREVTFREVGEGTNKSYDLDEFDLYYHHLFVWDRINKKIVGAYRIGKGNNIYRKFRKKGFYINTLFKIKNGFVPYLRRSLELGRSFIVKEYQQKPFSLFLLWKGILTYLRKNTYYKYLIGPVSISNSYSETSKALMVEFLRQHYFDRKLSKFIEPRKAFEYDTSKVDMDVLLQSRKKDLKSLDELISEIEPAGFKVPVLLKKYIKQEAKLLGFNVDPKFSNALDGFMIMDFTNVPDDTIKMLDKN